MMEIKNNGFLDRNKNQKGLSIIEALVSSVIVGIGFVAIFQMVNYSVNSINVSGERTKATYLVSMIAEGMVGYATEDGMVTSAMANAVEAAAAEIVSGSMEVADWSQE